MVELRVNKRNVSMIQLLLMIVSVSLSIMSMQPETRRMPSLQSLAAKKVTNNPAYARLIKEFDPVNTEDVAALNSLDYFTESLHPLLSHEFARLYGADIYRFLRPSIDPIYTYKSGQSLIVEPLINSPYFVFYNQNENILHVWDALSNREVRSMALPKDAIISYLCALTDTRIAYAYSNDRSGIVAWDVVANKQSPAIVLNDDVEKIVRINKHMVAISFELNDVTIFKFPDVYDNKPYTQDTDIEQIDEFNQRIEPFRIVTIPPYDNNIPRVHDIVRMNDTKIVIVLQNGTLYTLSDIYTGTLEESIVTALNRPTVKRINDHVVVGKAERGFVLKMWNIDGDRSTPIAMTARGTRGKSILNFSVLDEHTIFVQRLGIYELFSYQEAEGLRVFSYWEDTSSQAYWFPRSVYKLNPSLLLFTNARGDIYLKELQSDIHTLLITQSTPLETIEDGTKNLLFYYPAWYLYGTRTDGVKQVEIDCYDWQFDQLHTIKQWIFLYIVAHAQRIKRVWSEKQKQALLDLHMQTFPSVTAIDPKSVSSQILKYIESIILEQDQSDSAARLKRSRTAHEKGKEPMTEQENYEYEQATIQAQKRQKQDSPYINSDEE